MVNARLHIICGNCGSTELIFRESEGVGIDKIDSCFACYNCATLHFLTAGKKGGQDEQDTTIRD